MERFEMCFPLNEDEGGAAPTKWLIPASLDEFQPAAVTKEWQRPGSVRLRYVYDPLPEGVLPRFIVLTNLLSEGQPRWRNGVVLKEGVAEAFDPTGQNRNHVEVIAFGPDADRLRLLEIIQGNFDRIHVDLPDPKPIDEMELAGLPGIYRAVEDWKLRNWAGRRSPSRHRKGRSWSNRLRSSIRPPNLPHATRAGRRCMSSELLA